PAQREATDMNEVVAQVTRLLEAEARKDDVTLTCAVDPDLSSVVVDDAQLKQVLMNVVLNAIQASGPHGQVEVSTRMEGTAGAAWCVIEVADSGPGIPPEHVAQ